MAHSHECEIETDLLLASIEEVDTTCDSAFQVNRPQRSAKLGTLNVPGFFKKLLTIAQDVRNVSQQLCYFVSSAALQIWHYFGSLLHLFGIISERGCILAGPCSSTGALLGAEEVLELEASTSVAFQVTE